MNKLIKLSRLLNRLGHKEHSNSIIRLARESDATYIRIADAVISHLEDKIRSGEIYLADGPGLLLKISTTVDVDLSEISDYTMNTLGIMLRVVDPKIRESDSEKEIQRKKKYNRDFRSSEPLSLAIGLGFKMQNGELIGAIDIYPSYSLYRRLASMTKEEALNELFFGDRITSWTNTLRGTIAHELTHIVDRARIGDSKNPKKEEDYTNSKSEINARIIEVLYKLFKEEIGVDIDTGEGWDDLAKAWREKDFEKYSYFAIKIFELVNDGYGSAFIEDIMLRWGAALHTKTMSEDTRNRYIKRIGDIWNKLRDIHLRSAPPPPFNVPRGIAEAVTTGRHRIIL